jgi:uncharacterized membrane protein
MVPFVLLSFSIALVMVCGGITASVAFLEQRDVQSLCDGAAVAAANEIDEGQYFATSSRDAVPLSQDSVTVAVADYVAGASKGLKAWSTSTDGRSVQVVCTRYVRLPFAALFLGGREVERTARASARSPFSP